MTSGNRLFVYNNAVGFSLVAIFIDWTVNKKLNVHTELQYPHVLGSNVSKCQGVVFCKRNMVQSRSDHTTWVITLVKAATRHVVE